MNIETLKKGIQSISDPRRTRYGNIRHRLEDIIIIGLCTIICGGEDFNDMEEFGKEREMFLHDDLGLELPNGIPDADTFRRLFERLDPEALSFVLVDWLNTEYRKRCVMAIDGKTIRGSADNHHKAYHVVSAFVAESQITLGEITVNEKSNEITAVPELLDLLVIEDAIVTADAMSCQKKIVQKIHDGKADYTIALKGNQPELQVSTEDYFKTHAEEIPKIEITEKGHGRSERREYRLLTDLAWLKQREEWANLQGLGMVKQTVSKGKETTEYIRYFITSLTDLHEFAYSVRKHWSIENQLHWCLDVIFREDAARAKKDNSPKNMNVLRKTALSKLTMAKQGRLSLKKLMFKAALNPDKLLTVLFSQEK